LTAVQQRARIHDAAHPVLLCSCPPAGSRLGSLKEGDGRVSDYVVQMRFGDRRWRTIAVLDSRPGAAAEAAEAYAYAVAGGERVLGVRIVSTDQQPHPVELAVPGGAMGGDGIEPPTPCV